MRHRQISLAVALLGACSFSNAVPGDAPGTGPTVGFVDAASTADEKSSAHPVEIRLSQASTQDIAVFYEIGPAGTATPGADFDVTSGGITIPAGMMEVAFFVNVKADVDGTEPNETIELIMTRAEGASVVPANNRHEVTILSKALPRAGFGVATTMLEEGMDPVVNVVLDEPSEFPITVDYVVTTKGATPGTDFVLADGAVVFAPMQTSRGVPLDVLDDVLDEDDEGVIVTLATATNAFLDMSKTTYEHTILDAIDLPPTVGFAAATSSIGEAGGTAAITVQLSAVSGRTVTVPFSVDGAVANAATATADYSITGTSVTFAAGQQTRTIDVAIVNDTIDDEAEVVKLDLGTATNATTSGITSHSLTIVDDDNTCLGASPFAVCFATPIQAGTSVTLPTSLNTSPSNMGGSSLCANQQPIGWTTAPQSQPAACVIVRDSITLSGTMTVTGTRPLVLVAQTAIILDGVIDASSNNTAGSTGNASPSSECDAFPTSPQGSGSGAGGGAGATFMSIGGAGGTGDGGSNNAGGTAPPIETAVPRLRAGCNGQRGGNGSSGGSNASGNAGRGGGVVYLVTAGTLQMSGTTIINVSGSAGRGGAVFSGGSGGGSGGMVKLFVGTLAASAGAKIVSNGGGGASGGDNNDVGDDGSDPDPNNITVQAPGGPGGGTGAAGGAGFAGGVAAVAGANGGNDKGGGGGGGGGGYVQSNVALTNVGVSAGVIQIP